MESNIAEKSAEIKRSIEDKLRKIEEKEGRNFSPKQFDSITNGVLAREVKNLHKRYRIKQAIDEVLAR